MTGPEHYREAEQLLKSAEELIAHDVTSAIASLTVSHAQVHATLALAAATAMAPTYAGITELATSASAPGTSSLAEWAREGSRSLSEWTEVIS